MNRFKTLLVLLVVLTAVQTYAQNLQSYIVEGIIEYWSDDDDVRMYRINPVDQSRDEVAVSEIEEDGAYTLQYEFTEPDLYRLDLPGRQRVFLAVEEGQSSIKVNAEGRKGGYERIEGSESSVKLMGYERFRTESNRRLVSPAYAAMKSAKAAGDVEAEVEGVDQYVKGSKAHRTELLDYIDENIGSSFALYGTMLRWTGDEEITRLEKLVEDFATEHPGLVATSRMQGKVARYKKVAIGVKAPAISAATPDGRTLSLDEVEGDYILIDFWASWCGPCISQLPDLQKVYADFADQGFEILSVSVDSKEDRWKSAIAKHNMDWPQISDLKGWQSEPAIDYNVTFVPFNLLVDAEGTIIAKNVHSKTLYSTLSELLSSKQD